MNAVILTKTSFTAILEEMNAQAKAHQLLTSAIKMRNAYSIRAILKHAELLPRSLVLTTQIVRIHISAKKQSQTENAKE